MFFSTNSDNKKDDMIYRPSNLITSKCPIFYSAVNVVSPSLSNYRIIFPLSVPTLQISHPPSSRHS